jgi:hypothetical protein
MELDTIVQGHDGRDYIVVFRKGIQYWEVYGSCEGVDIDDDTDLISPCIDIVPPKVDTNCQKKRGRPAKKSAPLQTGENESGTEKPRGRGRPKKVVDPTTEGKRGPRAATAYNLFLQDKLRELKTSHPTLTNVDRMKLASQEWQNVKTQKTQISF